MRKKMDAILLGVLVILMLAFSGCSGPFADQLIINRYADALLTKNNELQFRFRVNSRVLTNHELYKVKITIHDEELAAAIGKQEIVYGEEQAGKGEYLEAENPGEKYIFMSPLPLKKDLHIQELRTKIEKNHAVSIEVFNDQEVLGRAFLTNFSSEL